MTCRQGRDLFLLVKQAQANVLKETPSFLMQSNKVLNFRRIAYIHTHAEIHTEIKKGEQTDKGHSPLVCLEIFFCFCFSFQTIATVLPWGLAQDTQKGTTN